MRRYLYIYISFFIAVFFTACSFTPKDIGKSYMFALSPITASASKQHDGILAVSLPLAAPELDTYRIALIKNNKRWDYYAGARWSDFMPLLVQDSIIKTLENSKLFKKVVNDQSGINTDQVLKIEIRSFEAEYHEGKKAPVIKIHFQFSLKDRVYNNVLAVFEVKTQVSADEDRISAIQAAFARSFKKAQQELVRQLEQASL